MHNLLSEIRCEAVEIALEEQKGPEQTEGGHRKGVQRQALRRDFLAIIHHNNTTFEMFIAFFFNHYSIP